MFKIATLSLFAGAKASCTKDLCPFSFTNPDSINEGRCGEVDAASRMPADIFKDPEKVKEYVGATIEWYHVDGVKLVQAPCDRTGRTQKGSEKVSWTDPTLMKLTCGNVCDCKYPLCPDSPDVPRNEQYCSLCGPKFNKPIEVDFWYPSCAPGPAPGPALPTPGPAPSPPPAPAKTIVELAVATPNLSTLVAALKAGKLVDTLSGAGPFTVFAPTNRAFNKLPAATLASLLDPKNIKQLQDILTYHVVSGATYASDLQNQEQIKTVEGKDVKIDLLKDAIGGVHVFINAVHGYGGAEVTTADIKASNGVVHIINAVLIPARHGSALTLTADPIPTPTTENNNTLYFYWKNAAYNRCGDVDAAPRMPAALFEPENKGALQAYINVTIDLYHITDGNPSDPQRTELRQGRCKDNGFTTLLPGCPQRKPNCNYPNPITAEWAPKIMMKVICDVQCKCKYPDCKDVPDDPKTKHWCSLCGPKYNAPIKVTLYNPAPL